MPNEVKLLPCDRAIDDAPAFTPEDGITEPRASLLNILVGRSGGKARVQHFTSLDWKSLTFTGERHQINMVAEARMPLEQMLRGIEDADFSIPGVIVADIEATSGIRLLGNGQFTVDVEVLTVDEDAQGSTHD